MPHQCTTCERTFPDGSKEMLSGCPDCGGNTFQFIPKGAKPAPTDEPPERPDPPGGSVTRKAARAGTAVRDWVSASGSDDTGEATAEPEPSETAREWPDQHAPDTRETDPSAEDPIDADAVESGGEDSAQSAARSDVVTDEELSWAASSVGESRDADPEGPSDEGGNESDGMEDGSPAMEDESPGIDELRRELNEQFESIRIVDRGTYELNLMELYKRDEYIIALREDGRYVIEMPESFRGER
jgi:uncharacterized protein